MSGKPPVDFSESFNRLTNPMRIKIIRELARSRAESPQDPALTFSELRDRLGAPDSGTFNYHLGQLQSEFVKQDEAGYVLSPASQQFVAVVASGGIGSDTDRYPQDIDADCPGCGDTLTLNFEDGRFGARCSNDHWFTGSVPQSVISGRPVEEAIERFAKYTWSRLEFVRDGICPACYNDLDTHLLEVEEDGRVRHEFEGRCHHCGAISHATVGMLLAHHPAVLALYLPSIPSYRTLPFWEFENRVAYETRVLAEDPMVVEVSFFQGESGVTLSITEAGEITVVSSE